MRKTIIALLTLSILLCSCGVRTEGEFTSGSDPDIIAKFESLLPDTDILGVPDEAERFLIPYKFNKPFKSVQYFLEMYDHGELVNTIDVFGMIGPASIDGELVENHVTIGTIENTNKSTNGFIAMFPETWGDMIPGLEFVSYLEDDKAPLIEKAYIEYDKIWPRQELTQIYSAPTPESDDPIKSGEPRIISFIGYSAPGEEVEGVETKITDETREQGPAAMVSTPYLLVLKCQFEF